MVGILDIVRIILQVDDLRKNKNRTRTVRCGAIPSNERMRNSGTPAMPISEFRPGFRFSAFDAMLLVAAALGALYFWPRTWWIGFVIVFVIGHFFLFCNVFRISRGLELIWAAVFLVLTRFTVVSGHPAWTTTALISLATTMVVVGIELRKPSYHGIGWIRINPNLPQWWEASVAQHAHGPNDR